MRPQAINLLCVSLIFLYFSSYSPFFFFGLFSLLILCSFYSLACIIATIHLLACVFFSGMALLGGSFFMNELNTFGGSLGLIGVVM